MSNLPGIDNTKVIESKPMLLYENGQHTSEEKLYTMSDKKNGDIWIKIAVILNAATLLLLIIELVINKL